MRGASPPAAPASAAGGSWLQRWRDWRNGLLAQPSFRARALEFAPTRWLARRHARELFDLMAGFVYSQVLLACVRLDLFETLAAGPQPADSLAQRGGLSTDAADRLFAAAASLQLLERRADGRVALGRRGAAMVGNPGLAAMVEHHATLYGDLTDPVALLRGESRRAMAAYWPYAAHGSEGEAPSELAAERVAPYSALMSASQPLVAQEVLAAYPFDRHHTLLDVGGGEGTFLGAVARQAPKLRLMLFDLPAVAQRAHARFAAWGLLERAQTFGGDFFEDELPRGADLVSLVRVCFDHPDERVMRLLRNVRRALPEDGHLVLAEPMSGIRGAEAMGDAYFGFYLLAMGRGRPRSAARLGEMLQAAGFGSVRQLPGRVPLQAGVLEARCRRA